MAEFLVNFVKVTAVLCAIVKLVLVGLYRPLRQKSATCVRSLCTRPSEWKPADASTTKCVSNVASARTLSSKCYVLASATAEWQC